MNCPCDTISPPAPVNVPAGLSELPLQFASFPQFRTAMLDAITREPALSQWRARSSDDFGVMLFEMWAYVCDSMAFYREVIGNEQYVRTAELRPSLRKLVDLLGYVPRPASSATVYLVAQADGRQPVVIPAGTAFRSGAFPGGTPQTYELDSNSRIHPLLNKWILNRDKPSTIDADEGYATLAYRFAYALPGTVTAAAGAILLLQLTDGSATGAAKLDSITDLPARDGITYKQLNWSPSVELPGGTLLANVQLTRATLKGGLWKQAVQPGDGAVIDGTTIVLDGVYRSIMPGSMIVLQNGSDLRWFRCWSAEESRKLAKSSDTTYTDPVSGASTTVSAPYPLITLTVLTLDVDVNDVSRRGWNSAWGTGDVNNIVVNYGFVSAAQVTMPYFTTLEAGDAISVSLPIESPADGSTSNSFQLEDKNGLGLDISGSLDFTTGVFTPGLSSAVDEALIAPITLYGNIISASRGETVPSEFLGYGDGTLENQSFTLKKSPLTYTPSPVAGNETGVVSSLTIWVNGLEWSEVPSFFGYTEQDQIYIVRQDDDGNSLVTFNGMLPTGVPIVSTYRFGAGALAPPAGSINQISKAVSGLKSIRNPVAASGGADAESPANLSTNAPKSALLLGRAVSIQDMQAAAANVPGVRAVQVEWRWNKKSQRPVIQVWYIGAAAVGEQVVQTLRGLSDPTTPFSVEEALPVDATLNISVQTDPRRIASDVTTAVATALLDPASGLLAPELIGIGATLFRSRIFEAVLAIPGAISVDGLLFNGVAFEPYGVNPGAGYFFDFENGLLSVNGEVSG